MRSAKPAELVLEKFGLHPFTFEQNDVHLPHAHPETFSAQV